MKCLRHGTMSVALLGVKHAFFWRDLPPPRTNVTFRTTSYVEAGIVPFILGVGETGRWSGDSRSI